MPESDNEHESTQRSSHQDTPLIAKSNAGKERVIMSGFGWKMGGLAAVCLIVLIYSSISFNADNTNNETKNTQTTSFDARLVSCKNVVNATPNNDFEVCAQAAEDGISLAINRLVWAYSRQGEHQDLGKVFEWLRKLPRKTNASKLLTFSLVHFNAESGDLRKDSEIGISALVAKNYAPANVVLASIYALEENVLPPTSNTMWLLNKASEKDPTVIEPQNLALIYANGLAGITNIDAGTNFLKSYAKRNFPIGTNNIAWFLATLDNNVFTNGDFPISLAQQVLDNEDYSNNPNYIDTLAATFAANNMFTDAVKTQELAIELVKGSTLTEPVKQTTIDDFTSRLSLYQQNKSLVESSLKIEDPKFMAQIRNRVLEYVLRDFDLPITIPEGFDATLLETNTPSNPASEESSSIADEET